MKAKSTIIDKHGKDVDQPGASPFPVKTKAKTKRSKKREKRDK